ncbi:MAG: pyruvate dehydrogenase [Candidatus Handelsmanbacteria bacterium RIFCSPLOWO2_12_FULL_64_10]|uniref:Pyruvate dehydrogenase n=1 Tax=Handelsmanbacteria sp. (strain RIFCSPLOWO2_12_FULL_64_10) TaxID=1817868 RepID=A0A1F6C9D1_HANXR|nr:MAG: pyruvate dehydrogenase [Candidatus Handelsmanbacteria bacterium RIFCSPLOWO2_12_FULL_64_10]
MSSREKKMTFGEAVKEAMAEEMRRDPMVVLIGEDVGPAAGVFKILVGLYDEFGPERVIDTPIAEAGFVGIGVGAALTGMRPIVEIMFGDFIALTMDQVVNQAAKLRYMSGGQAKVPLTIRATMGAGRSSAAQHSQSLHAWTSHIPGLKVAVPSTPADAKGLIKTAIRDDNPVIVYEDKMMYRLEGMVPEGDYTIPFGKADVKREGDDVTLIATSSMVHVALNAAETLAQQGISAEVVDPRTMVPLDREALVASVSKTGRAVIIDEGHRSFGVTAELASVIYEGAFDYLDAPIVRLGAMDVPVPFTKPLEDATIPTEKDVVEAVTGMMK